MMSFLSMVFYVLAHHPVKLMFLTPLALILAGGLLHWRKSKAAYVAWGALPAFVIMGLNVFFGQWLNAAFLHAVGVEGQGVVIDSRQTSSQLNEQWIWAYDVVVQTRDGQDVSASFTTMSVSIWPIRNAILIPPQGEVFKLRYVPGFEKNFVIMIDESPYGRRRMLGEWRAPVETAARRLAVNPDNPDFLRAYIDSLETFIAEHGDVAPEVTADYRRSLQRMRTLQDLKADAARYERDHAKKP